MSGASWDDAAPAAAAPGVTPRLAAPGAGRSGRWWLALGAAALLTLLLAAAVLWLLIDGVGVWGNNIPVTWALDIVGYDWWIGVACGALLVAAVLVLSDRGDCAALRRISETIAVLAACAAGLYPVIHLGRPWFFYWNLPYFNTFLLWPQVRSPLFWDAVDIVSYLGVALCLWYVGLLPDLAVMRDRATERAWREAEIRNDAPRLLRAQLYGIAALGWRGSQTHWRRWRDACRALAVCAVVLVVALQTGAAVMFAGTAEPGWHDTLLPVAFLAGAAYAGVGAVAALVVAARGAFGLGEVIGPGALEVLARLLLGLGLVNIYCYGASFATSYASGTPFETALLARRLAGPHAWSTWTIVALGLLPVQALWLPRLRRMPTALLIVGLAVAAASWADHFMVIVITLQHDFLPSAAHDYAVDAWGLATFAGTVGLFALLLLIAGRVLPVTTFGARGAP